MPSLTTTRRAPNWLHGFGAPSPILRRENFRKNSSRRNRAGNLMMQSLLVNRFKLAFHWQKETMPVYELVVGKGGFKAKPVPPDAAPVYGSSLFPCPTEDPSCNMFPGAPGTMSGLADILGPFVGRPVIDKTGIQGNYDRMLKWAGDTSIGSTLPSLPALLREKYGVELKSSTAPVDVIIIDHPEKPTPN